MSYGNGMGNGRPQIFDQDADRYSGSGVPQRPQRPRPQQGRPQPMPPPRRPAQQGRNRARRPEEVYRPSYGDRVSERSAGRTSRPVAGRTGTGSSGFVATPRRKKRRTGKVAIALFMVVLVLGTAVFALYNIYQNRMDGTGDQMGVLPDNVRTLPEFEKDYVSFLVCGLDYDTEDADGYSSDEKVGRTDMILYVHFNVKAGKISFLQLPRDTYVGRDENTGYKTNGTYKANALYYLSPDENRMEKLAKIFYEQYGLPVDFYVTIDLEALKALVEINGSIRVYVPQTITDPESGDSLEEGWQYLQGDHLEFFLRNRYSPNYNGQGDIARLRTQQSFYSALWREFKQLTPADLMKWMNTLTYYVKTDKDLMYLASIGLKALEVDGANLTFVRPACGSVRDGAHSQISLVADDMADLLNVYFRPEGDQKSVSELSIPTVPISENTGTIPREVKTMADVQAAEPAA